jgi:hypothetical protein
MGKKWTMFLLVAVLITGIPCASYAAKFKLADIDWDLSGSARLDVGYKFSDLGSTPTTPAGQESRQTDWFAQVPNNSRLGLRSTYENVSAYYEIGFNTRNNPGTNTNLLNTRYLYATYNFNTANSLLLGQTTSLLAPLDPEQHLGNDQQMKGFGNLYPSRNPQFKYSYVNGGLTASIALEDTLNACADSIVSGSHIVDNYVPVVQASLTYKNDMFMIMPSVYYQTYTLKKNDADATTKTVEIGSFAAALDGTLKTDIILLAMEIWYGQNLSTYGIDYRSSTAKQSTTMGAPVADSAGSDIKNVNSVGGWLQVGIPVKPVTIYLGYGVQQSQVKNTDTASVQYESSIMTQGAFVNAKWEVRKNFFIQPEVAYFDNGKDAQKTLTKPAGSVYATGDNNLGSTIVAGIHFQYDF